MGTDKKSLLQVGGSDAGQSDGIAGMSSTLFIIPQTCRNSAGLCNGFQQIFLLSAFGTLIPRVWFLPEVGCGGENELKSKGGVGAQVGFCVEIPCVMERGRRRLLSFLNCFFCEHLSSRELTGTG